MSISSDAQIVNVPQQEVDIEISGDKRKIEQINRSEITASLDLTDLPPGDKVVTLSPENIFVPLPQGVKLVEIAPSRIAVNLEAVEEKELDVKAETTGEPAPGFDVYSTSVLPPKIRVRGPASIVRPLEYVQTDKIDLAGNKENFTARQIPVTAPNPKAAVLNTFVDVVFRIGEKRIERSFTLPITGQPGKTATFTIYGPRTLLAKERSDAFKIEITKNNSAEGTPQLILPADLQDLVEIKKLTVR